MRPISLKMANEKSKKLISVDDELKVKKMNLSTRGDTKKIIIAINLATMLCLVYVIWFVMSTNIETTFEDEKKELRASGDVERFYSKEETKLKNLWRLEKQFVTNLESCTKIPVNERFDCHPENGASELSCSERGCCWDFDNKKFFENKTNTRLNVPVCYYPKNWSIYRWHNYTQGPNKFTGFMENYIDSIYKKDIKLAKVEITVNNDGTIMRAKIVDAVKKRYEPILPIRSERWFSNGNIDKAKFRFEMNESMPGFRIKRRDDGATLFDTTNVGGFIFADQFLQVSSSLGSKNIYGLGEHRTHFRLDMNWQSLTMFNKDQPPTENANLYGTHPFFLVMEDSGRCGGVLFLNSNAMDVILQPMPALTFRSIGGVFEVYFFFGPTPADVVNQYSVIVGKPFMPPYWSLGFHLSRCGYGSLEKTKEVWNRTRSAKIPFDTQWNDLDYMNNKNDFTYDHEKFKGLPAFVEEISKAGMHYIPLIDVGISASEPNGTYRPYDEGLRRGIFINESNSNLPFKGRVWNGKTTVWPDFTNVETTEWMLDMMNDMWNMFSYDGAWIDMSEPANFYNGHVDGCLQNELDNPPYVPSVVGNILATKTLCMNARLKLGTHYDVHNTYGSHAALAANYALRIIRKKRPFVIARSSWVGHGLYAGHWDGDVYSSWHDMRMSISQLLSFSLFQVPMMGSDICGFDGNTTESLCNRWMQLGAFYPFSRNHNTDDSIEQDPVAMGELVIKSSRKALMIRYRFLPYLYTLFFRAHVFGETVARPLFFEFAKDPETYGVDTQFLWGKSLMIVPVLEENATNVTAYLPNDIWYNFYDKSSIISKGENFTLDAPFDTIPLLIRGGSILPAQTPGTTTTASRKNKFELLIALNASGSAVGELFWDDGENLDPENPENYRWWSFSLDNQKLNHHQVKAGKYASGNMKLGKIEVMGVKKNVTKVLLNGNAIPFEYDAVKFFLQVKNLSIDLRENFVITWE